MKAKVTKWEDSLGLRLPKKSEELGIAEDEFVEVLPSKLVVSPVPTSYSLEGLVEQITDENRHDEVEWSSQVGNEAW